MFEDLIAPKFKDTDIYKEHKNKKCPLCGHPYTIFQVPAGPEAGIWQATCSNPELDWEDLPVCNIVGLWREWKVEDGEWKLTRSDFDENGADMVLTP